MRWVRYFLFMLIPILYLAWLPSMALASGEFAPKKVGEYGVWEAYEAGQGSQLTCYMMVRPASRILDIPLLTKVKEQKTSTQGFSFPRQRDAYIMVTFRPEESRNPVISYRSGYSFRRGSEVMLNAGGQSFNLFTDKDQAWARRAATDVQISKAIRTGKQIVIQGVSNEGGRNKDVFRLPGAERAYQAVMKACGIS